MVFSQLDQIEGQFQIVRGIAPEDIRSIAFNDKASSVQFCEPLYDEDYDNLEKYLFSQREDVELRAYDHQGEVCDLSFLQRIPSIKKISIDNIEECTGFENLSLLKSVKSLCLGINNLSDLEFLYDFDSDLEELSIAGTKLKYVRLNFLPIFKHLRILCLEGQFDNLHQISLLPSLRKLYLRMVRARDLEFLRPLRKLWFLDLKLGKINDLSVLAELTQIKQLTLCQLRGVEDLSFVSNMDGLQFLSVISIKRIHTLPNFDRSYDLRRVFLENLRDLKNFETLKTAPALEEFIYYDVNNHISDSIKEVLQNPTLKEVRVKFSEQNKNADFLKDVLNHDKDIFKPKPFIFQWD